MFIKLDGLWLINLIFYPPHVVLMQKHKNNGNFLS